MPNKEIIIWTAPSNRIRVKRVETQPQPTEGQKKPKPEIKFKAEHQVADNVWVDFPTSTILQDLVDCIGGA